MNWGYKILFVYLAFAAGIAFLAIKSMNEKMDLVTRGIKTSGQNQSRDKCVSSFGCC